MPKSIECLCGGTYLNNYDDFDKHCKHDEQHTNWIHKIIITCQCGGTYTYANQNNHFKASSHKLWQDRSSLNYNLVLYICKCGVVTEYWDRENHVKTHPT